MKNFVYVVKKRDIEMKSKKKPSTQTGSVLGRT